MTRQPSSSKVVVSYKEGSTQTATLNTTQLPTTAKLKEECQTRNTFYMYINDLLSTTINISLPARHLLNTLVTVGPIPLPSFYVEELDNVVVNAVISKEKKRIEALREFVCESPMKQLKREGVIRNFCYPLVYHKDFNPEYVDPGVQLLFVPKLICDAVKNEMDDVDKVMSILCAQHALENLLTSDVKLNLIHLNYILILCNQLFVCTQELKENNELLTTNMKLKLLVTLRIRNLIHH